MWLGAGGYTAKLHFFQSCNENIRILVPNSAQCCHGNSKRTMIKAAQTEILDYIIDYNFARLHSTLGYKSPMQYEKEQFLNVA
jgi:hypothetical protein